MKMKIFVFVAVAFVASSEATSGIPDSVRGFLTADTTPASGGISGFSTGLNDAADQIRGVDKGKGDSLKDTLKKLSNNTYSPPENFTSCLKTKNKETWQNLTELSRVAKNATDEIEEKYGDDAPKEPLQKYNDAFAKLNETLWTPLSNGLFENALEGLQKTANQTKNATSDVMLMLLNTTDAGERARDLFNNVNGNWHEVKKGINATIINCLQLSSSETSEN